MDYKLVSKLIFQNFIQNGVQVIDSTPMLKGLVIAYLLESSIVYNDTDVNNLIVEVMKFLTVEEINQHIQEQAQNEFRLNADELKTLDSYQSRIDLVKKKLNGIIKDINSILDDEKFTIFIDNLSDIFWDTDGAGDENHVKLFQKIEDDISSLTEIKELIALQG